MKKRLISLLLILSLMFSICLLCFVGSVSAETVNSYSHLVSLTFDGNEPYGIPFHRKVTSVKYENGTVVFEKGVKNGGTAWVGKNGSVGAFPVTQADNATLVAEAKENLFLCDAGKTYRLKFDYKFLAGTGGTSASIDVRLHPDPTGSLTANELNLSEHATLVESVAAEITFGDTATVLEQDTDWHTAYYIFTVNDDETNGVSIGFRPGYSTEYKVNTAIDNLTICEVGTLEYNESRLHTMDDATNDAFITASGCNEGTALVDNYDEEHGSVLKLVGGSNARLGFEDFDVKENRKYYISYDAKSETADTQPVTIFGANGSGTGSCRFFFTGYDNRDSGVQYFIDGELAISNNFKFSTEWRHYGIVIDTSNATIKEQILTYKAAGNFWTKWDIHFLFGVSNATAYFDNVQIIEIETVPEAVPAEKDAKAAVSVRAEKVAEDNNGKYQSAGLRFRATIDNEVKETADEMGFIVAPSSAIKLDTDWYKFENGINSIVQTAVCYEKNNKDIVYEQGTYQSAYQMVLTGLTSEDGSVDYLMRRFTAVLYVKTGDTYSYYSLGESSYKQVAATYKVMNVEFYDAVNGAGLVKISDEWKSHPQDYKLIAFTFDDGPSSVDGSDLSNNQNKIISTLNKYAGAGTMFIIGNKVTKYGIGQLQYAVDHGFEIASHTMNHKKISSAFLEANPDYTAQTYIDEEIKPLNDLIKQEMDYDIKYLRAAEGVITDPVLEAAIQAQMPLVRGNVDINGNTVYISDYAADTTPESIYEKVVSTAYDGKVVLMHGTSAQTAEILDDICATLYADGYRFVTVSELFEYKLKVTDPTQIDISKSYSEDRYINANLPRAIYRTSDVVLKYYNEDQWFLHPEDYKLIAFTFDDGPVVSEVGDNTVTRLIDLFGNYNGAATFYFTGTRLTEYGTTIPKYALSKGHELANHSYSHKSLKTVITERDATIDEVKKVNDWYKKNLDYTCKWFRGAGHSSNEYLWEYLTQIGMPATSGNYSHADHSDGSATVEDIVNNLTSDEIPHGSVILNHSTKTSGITPDALEQVLPILYEKGYRFCTLTQLFELQGINYEDIPTDGHIKRVYVENGEAVYEYRDK
ncbi:MAG: polysaccharide deacetylase family protein [Clostridia bacterium]|nr:polysaccharide deacetylase family protein [Clostridia bacterium]